VKRAVELKNLTKAVKEVYDTKHPNQLVKEIMKRPHIQIMFDRLIDDTKVVGVLRDQLEATAYNHDLKDFVPDNSSRLKAVDLSLKVKGAYPQDQKFNIGGQSINFIITKSDAPAQTEVIEGEEV
jgi:hypothetical protein